MLSSRCNPARQAHCHYTPLATMQPNAATLLGLTAMFITNTLAAECSGAGLCGLNEASTRNQLYAARQHVCGDTTLYQTSGS